MSYCDHCGNMGIVNCYCGGDLCVCENYGEMICPACHGECGEGDDDSFFWPEEDDEGQPREPSRATPNHKDTTP